MVNDPFPRKGSLPTSYHTPRMVYFQVRQQVVAAWSPRVFRLGLPTSSSPSDLTSPQGVSVLVLAVLVSKFHTPVEPTVCNMLVQQLLLLLHHHLEVHRSAAAELLGKGYHVWRAHLDDPSEVIRALFRLSVAWEAEFANGADGATGRGRGVGNGLDRGGGGGDAPERARPSQNCFQASCGPPQPVLWHSGWGSRAMCFRP